MHRPQHSPERCAVFVLEKNAARHVAGGSRSNSSAACGRSPALKLTCRCPRSSTPPPAARRQSVGRRPRGSPAWGPAVNFAVKGPPPAASLRPPQSSSRSRSVLLAVGEARSIAAWRLGRDCAIALGWLAVPLRLQQSATPRLPSRSRSPAHPAWAPHDRKKRWKKPALRSARCSRDQNSRLSSVSRFISRCPSRSPARVDDLLQLHGEPPQLDAEVRDRVFRRDALQRRLKIPKMV